MFIPVLIPSLKQYNRQTFRADLFAGLTVGVVAIPLAMAFAIACGLPPERGLYTAIIAGFLMACFTGCKVQVGGPTGAFVVIIVSILAQYGDGGLLISMILAGIFLIIFGFFKMGALIRFIPFPVTTGFTSGIAVVIFSTQIKDMLGLNIPHSLPAEFIPKWECLLAHLPDFNPFALGLTLFTILIIVLSRRYCPKLPAMLIAMLAATVIAAVFGLDVETIGSKFGDLPRGLPYPHIPEFSWAAVPDLIMPGFTIALLAGIESLLSATVADGMTGERHKPNIELIAQGIGNLGAVFFGGIPATGAIARTATNIKSGGKTPVSGIIHAMTLLVILLLFAPYAKMIPLSVLGGILSVVCYNMSEMHTFIRLFRGPKSDTAVLLITFVITILIDLVVAVEVGIVLAALLFIRRMAEISNVSEITDELREDEDVIHDVNSIQRREVPPGVEVFEVQGPFFFGAVDQFKDAVLDIFRCEVSVVILRMRYVPALDATGLFVLRDFHAQCGKRNIQLILSGVREQPYSVFQKSGFLHDIGKKNVCAHIDDALSRTRDFLRDVSGPLN